MINILTICTGKYNMFFEEFYNSCEKYFLPELEKRYFVFTEGEILLKDNIIKIHQPKLGWPYDTMMRFHMFNTIESEILENDYTFFFNVNMMFVKEINNILPSIENNNLVGVLHQGYLEQSNKKYPYERNIKSSFYIPYGDGDNYYQGCLIGGKSEDFMRMSNILERLIDKDLGIGIIPIWHDESAINWYFIENKPLTLDFKYAAHAYNEDIFGYMLDKNLYGGHQFLRN